MRLSDASIAIHPRSTWEAADLGVLLAQEHRGLLMLSWAMISLPIFVLLSVLLWDSPGIALLLFWWLKPAFERLPLFILSEAVFGEPPRLREALREWPSLLKPQLLASLTWRRLSLSRSFTLPVLQLEGLAGEARQHRLTVLRKYNGGAARWLSVIGIHVEITLWIGSMSLLYLMLPAQMSLDWSWQQLLHGTEDDWLWLEHLTNAFYALVLVLWEPIYVACGFSLYLNRRTTLEAWDIELVLRSLRQRLGSLASIVIIVTATWLPLAQPAWATAPSEPSAEYQADSPDSPRLQQQALNSQTAQREIQAIVDNPPFKNEETVTRWRLGQPQTPEAEPDTTLNLFDRLNGQVLARIAHFFEAVLWACLIGVLVLLAWHYRDWLEAFVSRRPAPKATLPTMPEQLFGLQVSSQSLPDDIAGSAERLWQSQPREALSLLYRALLNRLLSDYRLPLKQADTEGQVLEHVARLEQPALNDFSTRLTRHWQALAYGHRLPAAHLQQELCDGWRQLFNPGARQ